MAQYRDTSNESRMTISAEYKIHAGNEEYPNLHDHRTLVKVFDSGQPIEFIIQWLRCEVPREKGAELVDITVVLESAAL
jgi:hypothetical protein